MRAAYREVLAIRDARTLILAGAISQLGDWLYNAALLAYVYGATRSAAWVGAASVVRLLPYVVCGPLGGALADRHSRRLVLLAGDGARALVMGLLAVTVAARGSVLVVLVLTATASAAGSAEKPAAMGWLPRLVGESRLGAATALLHSAQDLGIVLGPLLGALLLALAAPWAAFAANAATFTASALLIASMARTRPAAGAARNAADHIRGGLRAVRSTPFAVALFGAVAAVELTYGAQTVQLVIYARRYLDLGPGGYGELLAATGAGGLLSAIFAGRLLTHRRVSLVVIVTTLAMCVTQIVYAATTVLAIAIAASAIGGAGLLSCEVLGETLLARIAPREALGRVIGMFDAVSMAAILTGALLAPALIAVTSLRTSMLVLGGFALLITAACFAGLRGLDTVSAERSAALASRVDALVNLPVTIGVQRLHLEQLAAASQFCSLPAGVDVIVQGAPAHAFYAVIDGQVLVHRDGQPVVHLGAGDSFGERGLLDNAPRNATITTEVETQLLRVEGSALLDVLESATSLRPALERSSTAPGIGAPGRESALVDDQRWVPAA